MSDGKVFAYILLNAVLDKELEKTLADYYWGGVVEAFIDCEEQSVDAAGLWPFEWGTLMSRPSVVQIVRDHDPYVWLSGLTSQGILHPFYVKTEDDGIIAAFKRADVKSAAVGLPACNQYHRRFLHLLNLAASGAYEDVIFIGGRGFSADMEMDVVEQQFLREAGIEIPNRMPSGSEF